MAPVQQFLMGLIAIGLFTTLVLPNRQSPAVINAVGNSLISNPLKAAING
jgi:hypothetical protein